MASQVVVVSAASEGGFSIAVVVAGVAALALIVAVAWVLVRRTLGAWWPRGTPRWAEWMAEKPTEYVPPEAYRDYWRQLVPSLARFWLVVAAAIVISAVVLLVLVLAGVR